MLPISYNLPTSCSLNSNRKIRTVSCPPANHRVALRLVFLPARETSGCSHLLTTPPNLRRRRRGVLDREAARLQVPGGKALPRVEAPFGSETGLVESQGLLRRLAVPLRSSLGFRSQESRWQMWLMNPSLRSNVRFHSASAILPSLHRQIPFLRRHAPLPHYHVAYHHPLHYSNVP